MRNQTAPTNTSGSLAAAAALGVALALLLLAGVPKPAPNGRGDSLAPLNQEELETWMRVVRNLPEGTSAGVLLGLERPDQATVKVLAQRGLTPRDFASLSRRMQESLRRGNEADVVAEIPAGPSGPDRRTTPRQGRSSSWKRRLLDYAHELRRLKLRH